MPKRICSNPADVAFQLIHTAFRRIHDDEKIAKFNWFKEHINSQDASGILFLSVLREIEIQFVIEIQKLNKQLNNTIGWIDRKEAIRFLQKQF